MKKEMILLLLILLIPLTFATEELIFHQMDAKSVPVKAFLQDTIEITNATNTWLTQVKGINITGIGQTICIIDTGINFLHPDLLGKNLTCNVDCFNKNCRENCSVLDNNGHGTHVAGIVAANGSIKGIAPDADLIGIKALDQNGDGNLEDVSRGINWCVENSENYNITVISMSLGTDSPLIFSTYCTATNTPIDLTTTINAINSAIAKNISVIAATGNEANKTHISAPACIENVTAVGATNKDNEVESYSNLNPLADLLAPGTNINSTSSSLSYTTMDGTSMSTPHVAAAFALVRQYNLLEYGTILSPQSIETVLKNTGKNISYNSVNYSRIDIFSAISSLFSLSIEFSPENNSYTNIQTNFTCNSSINNELTNTTFYLWNQTDLIYNQTKTISGTENTTLFNYSSLENLNYTWSCLTFDENNQNYTTDNLTITFDNVTSVIELISPENQTTATSNSVSFQFNLTETNPKNCTVIANSEEKTSITFFSNPNTISTTLSNGNYNWSIKCYDKAGNFNQTENRTLTVNYVTPPSGGGGGGSSSSTTTYSPAQEQITKGYSQELQKSDKIKLNIKNQAHELTLKEITTSTATVLIQSEPQIRTLEINQSTKISLVPNEYNLLITLNSIKYSKANITIQEINEIIVQQLPKDTPVKAFEENKTDIEKIDTEKTTTNKIIYLSALIGIILAGVVIKKYI